MATWVAPFHTIDLRPPCGGLFKIMPPNSCARYRIKAPMSWSESSRKVCTKFSTLKNHNPHLTDRFLIMLYVLAFSSWAFHGEVFSSWAFHGKVHRAQSWKNREKVKEHSKNDCYKKNIQRSPLEFQGEFK